MSTDTDKKRPVRIFEGELIREEFARSVYCLTAPAHAVPEDYLEAETYAHVLNNKIRAGDRLEITAEDRTWWAEVLILSVAGQLVNAALLRKAAFAPQVGKEHDAYEADWGGPSAKWRVLRKSDRAIMVDKFDQKSEAVAWIEANAGQSPEPLKKAA